TIEKVVADPAVLRPLIPFQRADALRRREDDLRRPARNQLARSRACHTHVAIDEVRLECAVADVLEPPPGADQIEAAIAVDIGTCETLERNACREDRPVRPGLRRTRIRWDLGEEQGLGTLVPEGQLN